MKKSRSGDINGFLDRTTVIQGELRFTDTMRIDGTVSGRVVSDNLLIVGESADIDAEIDVGTITIMGKVTGTLRATNRVEVLAGATLLGEVQTPVLRIDEGAVFQGRVDMNVGQEPSKAPARLALVETAETSG